MNEKMVSVIASQEECIGFVQELLKRDNALYNVKISIFDMSDKPMKKDAVALKLSKNRVASEDYIKEVLEKNRFAFTCEFSYDKDGKDKDVFHSLMEEGGSVCFGRSAENDTEDKTYRLQHTIVSLIDDIPHRQGDVSADGIL